MNTVYTRCAKLANSSYISTTLGTNLFALSGEHSIMTVSIHLLHGLTSPFMLINVL